jgi:hypothetical protein
MSLQFVLLRHQNVWRRIVERRFRVERRFFHDRYVCLIVALTICFLPSHDLLAMKIIVNS